MEALMAEMWAGCWAHQRAASTVDLLAAPKVEQRVYLWVVHLDV